MIGSPGNKQDPRCSNDAIIDNTGHREIKTMIEKPLHDRRIWVNKHLNESFREERETPPKQGTYKGKQMVTKAQSKKWQSLTEMF